MEKYQGDSYGGSANSNAIQAKGTDGRVKLAVAKKQDSFVRFAPFTPFTPGKNNNLLSYQSTSLTLKTEQPLEHQPLVFIFTLSFRSRISLNKTKNLKRPPATPLNAGQLQLYDASKMTHMFLIQGGRTRSDTHDFTSFKQSYVLRWGRLDFFLFRRFILVSKFKLFYFVFLALLQS
jgi:hypothetical protein